MSLTLLEKALNVCYYFQLQAFFKFFEVILLKHKPKCSVRNLLVALDYDSSELNCAVEN